MIRITLQYVWHVCEQLDQLERLNETKDVDRFVVLLDFLNAEHAVGMLLNNSVFAPNLRICRPLGLALLNQLTTLTQPDTKAEIPIRNYEIAGVKHAYSQFKTAFLAELGTFPAYFVTQKGSHDTLSLLDQPWLMFPDDLRKKVPEAMYDVAEAGKALCYETATASGFHLFRATEAVLRRYYSHVTGGKAHPKVRNIMVYVQAMRQAKCGDEKVLAVIEQLAKLHRNPIAHPEAILTIDEAISMLGLARSAVTFMLAALPVPLLTTATAAVASGGGGAGASGSGTSGGGGSGAP